MEKVNHITYFQKPTSWNLCCKQATYLTLKKEAMKKLSWKEELSLSFHMLICRFCRIFKKQSELMNNLLFPTEKTPQIPLQKEEKNNFKELIINNLH